MTVSAKTLCHFSLKEREREGDDNVLDDHLIQINVHVS